MYLTRALQPPLLAGPPRKAEEVVYSRVRSAVDMFMDLERGTAGKETIVENTERRELCGAIYALKEFLAQQVKMTGKNDWLRCSSMTCNNYRNSPFANGCARKDKHVCKYQLATRPVRWKHVQEEERIRIAALYNAFAQAKPDGHPVEGMLTMIVPSVRAIF